MKHYDEKSVVLHLNRYTNATVAGNTITIPRGGVGIHTAGKIDFLVNHCHYIVQKRRKIF